MTLNLFCRHTLLNGQTVLYPTIQLSISKKKFNVSKYCYVLQTIQLNISHLLMQLNDQTALFLTIHFRISHLFTLS